MSEKKTDETVDEVVDSPVEEPKAKGKSAKAKAPKTIRVFVYYTNPYGRPGDIVVVDPNDSAIKHLLATDVIVEV